MTEDVHPTPISMFDEDMNGAEVEDWMEKRTSIWKSGLSFDYTIEDKNGDFKRAIRKMLRKPRTPRKVKKRYKREYAEFWKLNYELDHKQRECIIENKQGKQMIANGRIHLQPKEFNGKPCGKWQKIRKDKNRLREVSKILNKINNLD